MQTLENNDSTKQQHPLTESFLDSIPTTYKILGLYSISDDLLNKLHMLDEEVLLDSKRLYLVIETFWDGEKRLFATPFRTNIPKNQIPYKPLRKMSGTGNTRKGCTHGLHIAKTIPVTKKSLESSRHAKAYKPLIKDGTINGLISDVLDWINQFDDSSVAEEYTPYYYSVKLKQLAKAVNK